MKKVLLTLITSIYLMLSCGFAMDVHFCMGNKIGVDFYESSNKKCGKCGMMEKKGGCCRDEVSFHKLNTDHAAAAQQYLNHTINYAIVLPKTADFLYINFPTKLIYVSPAIEAPPNIYPLPLFIRNQVFRI